MSYYDDKKLIENEILFMPSREIPFRPKLEGEFRVRFYNAASEITDAVPIADIEKIANKEIKWVEDECRFNLEQRKRYRAIWLLFRDLIRASWKSCYKDGILYMSLPSLNETDTGDTTSSSAKALLRGWMSESRHERLVAFVDFINHMENPGANKLGIDNLIADGNELVGRLEAVKNGKLSVTDAIKPYLQLVEVNARDEFTGLKLQEIWRYFRLTWSTPAETTPGRTMQYLIRDAAHPKHAVMGIASLENCAVQITCRDDFIGWNQKAYIEKMLNNDSTAARQSFLTLLRYISDGISGIDYSELCSQATIDNPTDRDIQTLRDIAADAEQRRQQFLKDSLIGGIEEEKKSGLGRISKNTEKALYDKKRAEQLANLLSAKKAITDLCSSESFDESWKGFCKGEDGNSAIRRALVAQKTKHIGSSMMELNVCGAIPPYNEVLGGKLVALLAISPRVVHDYKERYAGRSSEIASRLKGEPVCRPADLVYVGTTSLYYVGSSQYNRLKLPGSIFESDFDVVWKQLGMTMGFGTMHISKATTKSLAEATTGDFNRINHVFGEGTSPKMRLLAMSIRELLESTDEDLKDFSKHAMPRIVYGACLAKNTFEYLMGTNPEPEYYTDMSDYQKGTDVIINFWQNRWLGSRLNYEPIYERVRGFDKKAFLVSNQINEDEEWNFTELREESHMPAVDENQTGLRFIRGFYRGSSAYADYIDSNLLSSIHLETKLDEAILNAVKEGKDIVLTGNPGDGKTHIIKILKKSLNALGKSVSTEIDASALRNEEIYKKWKKARDNNVPYVIAINAAVLYSLYQYCKGMDFEPVKKAYEQMIHAVVFHDEDEETTDVVVYDLSKREVLTKEILSRAIIKFADDKFYEECKKCPLDSICEVHRNCKLLKDEMFQSRLFVVLQRVALQGYHATLRELQSFISYLIFGDRTCKKISSTTGDKEYNLVNLIYSGKGELFKAIQKAFDPVNISHPIWDERLLSNDIAPDTWVKDYEVPAETIVYDNEGLLQLRRRQFFFFNANGNALLEILDDEAKHFQEFIKQDDSKIIKELILKLNKFFGAEKPSNSELQIWSGHRYNNKPRTVLISVGSIKKSGLRIGRPTLSKTMQAGIEMTSNYIRLEKKNAPNIFLKIDFGMYGLLAEANRGVPVLFIESDLVKNVWRFIEQLQSVSEINGVDPVDISLLDLQNKKKIVVELDQEENKYSSIGAPRN